MVLTCRREVNLLEGLVAEGLQGQRTSRGCRVAVAGDACPSHETRLPVDMGGTAELRAAHNRAGTGCTTVFAEYLEMALNCPKEGFSHSSCRQQ